MDTVIPLIFFFIIATAPLEASTRWKNKMENLRFKTKFLGFPQEIGLSMVGWG